MGDFSMFSRRDRNGSLGTILVVTGSWYVLSGDVASADSATAGPTPPPARVADVVDDYHGVKVADPYRWLEKTDDPETIQWVNAEDALTRAYLDRIPVRTQIKDRLEKLYAATSISSPTVVRDKYFSFRREGLQNHAVLYVRQGHYKADPRVLIDPNAFSQDGTVALDWTSFSPDGRLVAYGRSSRGDERSTLYVKNVETGEHLTDEIPGTRYCGIAWLPDGKSFYYTRYPIPGTVPAGEENYNRKVYFHRLGDDWHNDRVVVADLVAKEELVDPYSNATDEWLLLRRSLDWSKNDLYLRPLPGDEPFRPIAEGLPAEVSADIVYGKLFIRTDYQAPRFRIMTADPANPAPDQWKELIPQQPQAVISAMKVVDHKIVLLLKEDAHSRLVVHDLDGRFLDEIKLPTLGSVGGLSGEWDDTEIFFDFDSFAFPPTIYRYALRSKDLEVVERTDVDVDTDRFETRQHWFTSKDGTRVPMFVVHRRGISLDGQNPTLLNGYGGFDISLLPNFSNGLFPWLERGGVYAVANIRGGGEFGREWHLAGRLERKQNVFDDFIAAAEALIKLKYTSPDKLAISGGSNGGLLVGACAVQRPDLFRAVVCAVPLLDMLRYHQFEIARLWIPEYGSADDPEQFKWLYAYSPYHNVHDGTAYPAMLIMTGDSDSRVHPLHAWKMTARLQAANKGDRPILMHMDRKAGHGAGKPLSKRIADEADKLAFLMNELGVVRSPQPPAAN